MQISGSGTPAILRLSASPQTLKTLPLHNGQTVTATVLPGSSQGMLNLDINGKLLQVISNLRLTAGMTLQLRVERDSHQLLLHIDDKTLKQLTHQQALRQNLPLQEPLKPLLERLQQLTSPAGKASPPSPSAAPPNATPASAAAQSSATTKTPAEHQARARIDTAAETVSAVKAPANTDTPPPARVQQAIARLLSVLPALAQITSAEGLKQAIAASGMFLESNLLHPSRETPPDKDVKTALLRLARAIRQSLAEDGAGSRPETARGRDNLQALLRQVDSGLARIQLHQLNSLAGQQSQGDERQLVTLELPLLQQQEKNIELLQLKIQRESKSARSGAGDCWSVTLHLSPADYGDIHAVVSLTGGKVSTTFWCQQEETGQLFREQLDALQQRLSEQGLETGRFTAMTGQPPEPTGADDTSWVNGLIDTRV